MDEKYEITHLEVLENPPETTSFTGDPASRECGCNFTTVNIAVPQVIRDNLEGWDTLDEETILRVKKAFVEIIPALAPADSLKMGMGPSNSSAGFIAVFLDRPYKEATITPDKKTIWLLD